MKLKIYDSYVLKTIGLLQIVGGVTSLLFFISTIRHLDVLNGPILLIIISGFGLFAFCIYAGYITSRPYKKGNAIWLSIINQALQVFQFKAKGYGLVYNAFMSWTMGYNGFRFEVDYSFLPYFQMNIASTLYMLSSLIKSSKSSASVISAFFLYQLCFIHSLAFG